MNYYRPVMDGLLSIASHLVRNGLMVLVKAKWQVSQLNLESELNFISKNVCFALYIILKDEYKQTKQGSFSYLFLTVVNIISADLYIPKIIRYNKLYREVDKSICQKRGNLYLYPLGFWWIEQAGKTVLRLELQTKSDV